MADKFDFKKYYKDLEKLFKSGPVVKQRVANKIAAPGDIGVPIGTARAFLKNTNNAYTSALASYGQYNRLARYSDYNEMESMAEISSGVDIYADETCSKGENGEIIEISSTNVEIRESLNRLFYDTLNIEFNAWTWIRNLCKFGDQFLLVDHHPDYGILNLLPIPINEIEREEGYDKENPLAYRYRWITQGNRVLENWQVIHFRILGNDNFLPYGSSILEPARRVWRQLILMEDAVMVYRIVRSPERRVFYIGVGNVAPQDIPAFMQKAQTQLKRNQIVDSTTGRVDLRYNPLSTDEDYFVPVRGEGDGTRIDTLPGGQFTGDIEDLTYIQNKLFAALKIPKSYLGYEGDTGAKCLHPDTKIPLLDGRTLTIKEICEEISSNKQMFAYTIDEKTLSPVPGKILAGGVTRKNAQLVEIVLDNGSIIKCTPDHKFMLRDGNYREAQFLQSGQSLMPHYTKISEGFLKGYEEIYDPAKDKYVFTHRCVAEYLKLSKKGKVIHHRNFNKRNNNPDNLDCSMSFLEHRNYHKNLTKETLNSKENIQKRINDPKWLLSVSEAGKVGCLSLQKWREEGGKHKVWNKGLTAKLNETIRIGVDKITKYKEIVKCKNKNCENMFRRSLSKNSSSGFKEFCSTHCSSQHHMKKKRENEHCLYWITKNCLTCNNKFETRKKKDSKFCSMMCRRTYNGYKNSNFSLTNHKVVSIRWIEEKVDCYDIQIENFPNFAISAGVFVHNSTLSQQDVQFARTIQRIQRVFVSELNKIAIIHLYSMGFRDTDLTNFEIAMANPSSIAEMQKLELWRTKFEVAMNAQEGMFDRHFVYKKIFKLTDEDIEGIEEGKRKDRAFDMGIDSIQSADAPTSQPEPTPEDMAGGVEGEEGAVPPQSGADAGTPTIPTTPSPEAGLPPPPGEESGPKPITSSRDPMIQSSAPNELLGKSKKNKKKSVFPDLYKHAYGIKKTAMDPQRNYSELTRMVKAPFGESVEDEKVFNNRMSQLRKFAKDLEDIEELNLSREKKTKKVIL